MIEFPWTDNLGRDQFLDIVASSGRFVAGIECKKTAKEALTFLLPQGADTPQTGRARLVAAHQILEMPRRWELFCGPWEVAPLSYETAFCVVSTSDSGKNQRLLERDVASLILGTDEYARRSARTTPVGAENEPPSPFVPVLVTNAPLTVARYEPSTVSLDTGTFCEPPEEIQQVSWVRFRKSFPSHKSWDLGERTAFVVNASQLSTFLVELARTPSRPPGDTKQCVHLPKTTEV